MQLIDQCKNRSFRLPTPKKQKELTEKQIIQGELNDLKKYFKEKLNIEFDKTSVYKHNFVNIKVSKLDLNTEFTSRGYSKIEVIKKSALDLFLKWLNKEGFETTPVDYIDYPEDDGYFQLKISWK